jgi:uncharacterized membrane protein
MIIPGWGYFYIKEISKGILYMNIGLLIEYFIYRMIYIFRNSRVYFGGKESTDFLQNFGVQSFLLGLFSLAFLIVLIYTSVSAARLAEEKNSFLKNQDFVAKNQELKRKVEEIRNRQNRW